MNLSSALMNAASGLRAQGRAADVISSNVANALTPGYARRELSLAADDVGGGVRIAGVERVVDPVILAERRLAEAEAGHARVLADGLKPIEQAIGEPGSPGSLSERIALLNARLIESASAPDAELRLSQAVDAARSLAEGIGEIGTAIQDMRTRADSDISTLVQRMNDGLHQVESLNAQILRLGAQSRESSALQETRQQAVDTLSDIVPLRVMARDTGTIALYTTDGVPLLDGSAQALGFAPVGDVQPWMSLGGGALSGLTIGGRAVEIRGDRSVLGSGALRAQLELRDVVGPEAQEALDALARDLVERFQDPVLDSTLPPGPPPGPGLFTDAGMAFDVSFPFAEEGLAQRLATNAAVDPEKGGEAWRLRDGIGAVAPGPPGEGSLLAALADRLTLARAPASGPQAGRARSFEAQAAEFLSGVAVARQARESESAYAAARLAGAREAEAANGVDMDDELQQLLIVEQAYAANARVVQTVDSLLLELLRI